MTKIHPDESHVRQVQEDYKQILAGILRRVTSAPRAKEWGLDSNSNKDIRFFVSGKEVHKNEITSSQIEKLKVAIGEPKNLKGSVQIKIGKEKVFHVKDGALLEDKLELTQGQVQKAGAKLDLKSLIKDQIEQTADPVHTQQLQDTNDPLGEKLNSLENLVAQQVQKIELLEQKLNSVAGSVNLIQNKPLSQWLSSTFSKVTSQFQESVNGWSHTKTLDLQKIRQKLQSFTNSPVQQRLKLLEATVNTVNSNVREGIKDIQSKLAALQERINSLQENPAVQSAAKAVVEKIVEPVVAMALEKSGVIQSINILEAERATDNKVTPQPSSQLVPENLISAAQRVLERIPSQSLEGTRSFKTGRGYLFEAKGDNITIFGPNQNQLISSVGKDNTRQINVSNSLTHIESSHLREIGDTLNKSLSALSTQAENQTLVSSQRRKLS